MSNTKLYEEQILKELKAMPEEALPKVLRLLALIREEFCTPERRQSQTTPTALTSHERTQQLLATSQNNWSQELIAEREDRL
jgi:hypothetical protein